MTPWLTSLRNAPTYSVVHVARDVWDKTCEVVAASEHRYGGNPSETHRRNEYLDELLTELREMVDDPPPA